MPRPCFGAAVQLSRAIVRRVWAETPRLTGVVLEVAEAVTGQHERPGQVISVALADGKAAYFALANHPGEARALELLVDANGAAVDLSEGAAWQISAPMGAGFDLEPAAGKDIFILGQGSAIAALRPVVEAVRRRRDAYRQVSVHLTARDAKDFAYVREYSVWRSEDIAVAQVLGQPFMQERLAQQNPRLDHAVAYVCGSPPFMDDVSARLVSLGMAAPAIYRNW